MLRLTVVAPVLCDGDEAPHCVGLAHTLCRRIAPAIAESPLRAGFRLDIRVHVTSCLDNTGQTPPLQLDRSQNTII